MRLFPFLGFKSKKYQQFGTPFLLSQVECELHTVSPPQPEKEELASQRFNLYILNRTVISVKPKDYHLLADARSPLIQIFLQNFLTHSLFSFQHTAKQTSSLLKQATLQSPSMSTFLFIPRCGLYQFKRFNFRIPYFKNYSLSPLRRLLLLKIRQNREEIQLLLHSPIIQSLSTNYIINSIIFLFNHCKWNEQKSEHFNAFLVLCFVLYSQQCIPRLKKKYNVLF